MFKIGLCSITFRGLSVEEVIKISQDAKLDGIEWGGDVHVPPGDLDRAERVNQLTVKAGLEVASYGSYYRVGEYDDNEDSFEKILNTAEKLKAPSIRIWAGKKGSDKAHKVYREKVVDETRRIATQAAAKNIRLNFEYHGQTLTDTKESASLLMEEIDHPNVSLYWQPAVNEPVSERLDSIDVIKPWLSDVHVFQWDVTRRLALKDGKEEWGKYLKKLSDLNTNRYLFIEFVKGDSQEQFFEDAELLIDLMQNS